MKLFLKPGACSLCPHIVLEELGLSYETEAVDLRSKQTASGHDYLAINPKGYVPALQLDGGVLLTELPAIVQYLADLVPGKQLAPANGSLERYQLQAWLGFIGTELHKSFGAFFNPAAPQEWKDIARANLERRLSYVEAELAERDHLLGAEFTVADAYLFTVLRWLVFVAIDLARWPRLQDYQARIAARPTVQAALRSEGLA